MGSPALNESGSELIELNLKSGVLTIGSSNSNDFVLSGKKISSNHCKIVTYFHMALLIDTGSTTGSFLNNRRIIKHSLKKGDYIRLGDQEFVISDIAA